MKRENQMKTVKVYGIPYKVEFGADCRTISSPHDGSRFVRGQMAPLEFKISIWKGMPPESIARTFYHELLHAIIMEGHIAVKDKHEEAIVDQMANGLAGALESLGFHVEKVLEK